MENSEVAKVLYEIADILEVQGVEFKPSAYRNAARQIEFMSERIESLAKQGKLQEIEGVGKAIAEKITELMETGHLKYLDELKKQVPIDVEGLMSVPGIGPKKVKLLYEKLKITNISELEDAAKKQKIRSLEGLGEKTEREILENLEFQKKSKQRYLLGDAVAISDKIVAELRQHADRIAVAGSLRRMADTIGDIDILATSRKRAELVESFAGLKEVEKVSAKGDTKCSARMKNGLQVDLRIIEEKSWGSGLNYFTGSKEHNIALRRIAVSKGLKLSEYGLFDKRKSIAGKTEEGIYNRLGMNYIEPELRENRGEVEASQQGKLPKLVGYDAIKGDLQIHTNWSDGLNTIEEMTEKAKNLGYEYIGITDHAGSMAVANSLNEKRVLEQQIEIRQAEKKTGIRILHGLEVNIKDDGNLDMKDKALEKVDYVIAAIHSGFKNTREKMTNRICKALENKHVRMLAHPTGRLIDKRPGYDLDLEKVFEKARETGKFLEINSHPSRLDLSDTNTRAAIEHGIRMLINTDSHTKETMDNMRFGIATARRAWCEKKDVLNSLPLKKFDKEFL
ncbi:MAG: DNA polymerase/3'-5' exonuclease PolX [Candidatus Woesearchaeota archaeon]